MESCHRLLDGDFEAEFLQPRNAPGRHRVATNFVEVVWSQVDEVRAVLEHAVDGDEDGVGDRHRGAFGSRRSTARSETDWEALRKERRQAKPPQLVDPRLTGLIAAWDSGDGGTRRELLATLFSDIHVSQGRVVGYTPRPDRQAQVTRLMDTIAWKVSVMVGGDGSSAPLTDSLHLVV